MIPQANQVNLATGMTAWYVCVQVWRDVVYMGCLEASNPTCMDSGQLTNPAAISSPLSSRSCEV